MNISKFFCMLIAELAIIGFTTIGLAEQEEGKQSEDKEAIKSEAAAEGESAAKEESKAESKEVIQYGANPESESGEKEAKAEEKE
jgi:hypothetical protein